MRTGPCQGKLTARDSIVGGARQGRDAHYILDDIARHPSRERRMPEECAEIKGTGQHIQRQLDIEIRTDFTPRACPGESLAHGFAASGQHLLADGVGKLIVLRHVGDQPRECLPHRTGKGSEKRLDSGLQIITEDTGVGCWVVAHGAEHCIGNQVTLTGPASVDTGARPFYLACNTVNGYRSVPAAAKRTKYG